MNLDAQQTKNLIATMGLIKAQIDNYNAQSSLARETAKNQSYIRSNIASDTANKGQLFESMKRSNWIGNKYDYSDRILNYDTNSRACYRDWETDRKSTRLNSSHSAKSRMPSSA